MASAAKSQPIHCVGSEWVRGQKANSIAGRTKTINCRDEENDVIEFVADKRVTLYYYPRWLHSHRLNLVTFFIFMMRIQIETAAYQSLMNAIMNECGVDNSLKVVVVVVAAGVFDKNREKHYNFLLITQLSIMNRDIGRYLCWCCDKASTQLLSATFFLLFCLITASGIAGVWSNLYLKEQTQGAINKRLNSL